MTKNEAAIASRISEGHLLNSLSLLRDAMAAIWSPEVRIIRGYTDHGEAHCERVAGYATAIIQANTGQPFTDTELYLLLAGIYLHDIGMQCDVKKHPDILTSAIEHGATVPSGMFSDASSQDYSIEEQKVIRKNHHLFSAAWLRYAVQHGTTSLGQAAKSIPNHLLLDIIDVCIHHTTLPIANCRPSLALGGRDRKQFVAAILRFADELDISAGRVNIGTVLDFNVPPDNAVYWWLHNATQVTFDGNAVTITVALAPNDYDTYRSVVREIFLSRFQEKNRPVLDVLRQNGTNLILTADSDIVKYEFGLAFPPEIIQALTDLAMPRKPVSGLADEVATWLRAIRFEVPSVTSRDHRTVDIPGSIERGAISQRVLFRCVNDEITVADVNDLVASIDLRTPHGVLISQARISPGALLRANDEDIKANIRLFTLPDFLAQEVWSSYIGILQGSVEKEQYADGTSLYVDIGCYKLRDPDASPDHDRNADRYDSLDRFIDAWLLEQGKKHISLLGEFGTGKTWFCRHYAHRQLARYMHNPMQERFPVLITLRSYSKALNAEQLINDALLVQYQLPFVGNAYETFTALNQAGKLLLILDGFDEMARQVDYQTVVDNFRELANLVTDESKVILTSRTEYFRQATESEKIFSGRELGRRSMRIEPPEFEVVYLSPLTDAQVRQIVRNRMLHLHGEVGAAAVAEKILSIPNLAAMGRKPLLVDLLLAALEEVNADVLEKPAQVYLYATNKLILRNIMTERTFTTTSDKLFFLCELAWEMTISGELSIHFKDIPRRISTYFGDRIRDEHELDHWDYDLRNQTLLHRRGGYYEFAHKSLMEYFVALKLAAEIGCLPAVVNETYQESEGVKCNFPFKRHVDWDPLAKTFGRIRLSAPAFSAIVTFLIELISLHRQGEEQLWKYVYGTRNRSTDTAAVIGANALHLLKMLGADFRGRDLDRIQLYQADFRNLDLTGASFKEARLAKTALGTTTLSKVNLTATRLLEPVIHNTDIKCYGTILRGTITPYTVQQLFVDRGALVDDGTRRELARRKAAKQSNQKP